MYFTVEVKYVVYAAAAGYAAYRIKKVWDKAHMERELERIKRELEVKYKEKYKGVT